MLNANVRPVITMGLVGCGMSLLEAWLPGGMSTSAEFGVWISASPIRLDLLLALMTEKVLLGVDIILVFLPMFF